MLLSREWLIPQTRGAKLDRKKVITEKEREGKGISRFQATMKLIKLESEEAINKEWMTVQINNFICGGSLVDGKNFQFSPPFQLL